MTKKAVLNELKQADFQPLLNTEFSIVSNGAKAHSIELVEVKALSAKSAENQRSAFSLIFRGQNSEVPLQSIYILEHAQLGQLEIFLVPIGPDQQGMRYEAVFT